ncbi:hypothetical protein BCR39DRAFT_584500 [Naematelia encephala]|uniref:Uncharacterized protein n=1 Tax=Naematelia encephala TaxID=71784 RepID=A0A1Y2AJD8_9TREE|nr:hypothetical protein BCR39DRAFT_584500 [Naematelia encephala]
MSKLTGLIASYEAQYGSFDEYDPTHQRMFGAFISGIAVGTTNTSIRPPDVTGPPLSRTSPQRLEAAPPANRGPAKAVARRKADRLKNSEERKLLTQLIDLNVSAQALIDAASWYETEWCQADAEQGLDSETSREARKELDDAAQLTRSRVKEVHNALVDCRYRPSGRGPRLHLESAFFLNLPFEYLYSQFYPDDEDDLDHGLLSLSVHRICKHLRPLRRYLELANSKPDMDRVQRWQKKHNYNFVKRIRDQSL